ncbi:MAG: peptide ABC transporter permease, partial [Desulfitobacterium hafniense]|nr:peptide ABC transporter permease [Desulfitobacterium hafniense]
MGRDIYSRILYGGRISLSVSILSVLLSTVVGTLFGGISGY